MRWFRFRLPLRAFGSVGAVPGVEKWSERAKGARPLVRECAAGHPAHAGSATSGCLDIREGERESGKKQFVLVIEFPIAALEPHG